MTKGALGSALVSEQGCREEDFNLPVVGSRIYSEEALCKWNLPCDLPRMKSSARTQAGVCPSRPGQSTWQAQPGQGLPG